MDQKQEEEAARHAEHFESIPWESFLPDAGSNSRRVLMVVVMVIVGIAIGLVGGGLIRDTARSGVVLSLPEAAEPEPRASPAPEVTQSGTAPATLASEVPVVGPLLPQLYSEADLMAVLPDEEMRAAAMRAEWFVTDFFTAAESVDQDHILSGLPEGVLSLALPRRSGDRGTSYIEWARAYRVEPLALSLYRVSVAFRMLAGSSAADLSRTTIRAVTVDVEVGVGGSTAVIDLPSPAIPPQALVLSAPAVDEVEAPPDVLAAALRATAGFGSSPVPLSAGLDAAGWRIVVVVEDEFGLRWPLVVRG